MQTIALFSTALEGAGRWMTRYLGAAFLGFAVINWLARNTVESEARRAIVVASFVSTAIGFLVAIMDAIDGVGNALIWLSVVLYLLLALGFGYFQFLKREAFRPAPAPR